MSPCCWWDSKPVHLLATGASLLELTVGMKNVALVYGGGVLKDCLRDIGRNTWAEGEPFEIPCHKLVKDYHYNMVCVDVHDQLRLQRFSVQNAFRFKKYYKACSSHASRATSRMKPTDMEEQDDPTPFQQPLARRYINRLDHVPSETQYFHGEVGDPDRKRMHRACKVCSILAAPGKRGKNTKWVCEACSEGRTGDRLACCSVYLCQLIRRESFGIKKSCFSIWHEVWDSGKRLWVHVDKRIQYRRPTEKKRRHQTGQTISQTIMNSARPDVIENHGFAN
ncbi:hypothetical protein ON010_g4868 [Phytophthora cinnamomi]|nr:hypothetical protein ON010_g4868 [Phytophthora cinnamomi]